MHFSQKYICTCNIQYDKCILLTRPMMIYGEKCHVVARKD
jgi:hypothetical protein